MIKNSLDKYFKNYICICDDSDKKFFIVWKCAGEYFYWQINHDKKDYYIENQFGDYGKGFNQEKNVVNVKLHALTRVN